MAKKLFVGNIEWGASEDDLRKLFAEHGEVGEVVIIKDKFSGRSKGFGFVTFENDEEGEAAIKALHDHELNGRKLVVNEARPREDRD